jgi:hypothetical protein
VNTKATGVSTAATRAVLSEEAVVMGGGRGRGAGSWELGAESWELGAES